MRHETKRILLTAAMLCGAGCTKSELQMAQPGRSNLRSYSDSAMANVKDEKPPQILPQTHFAAGMLFERQGQVNEAMLQYRKAVALNHNYVAAYHRLGLLQSATGQHFEAAQSFQSAVALRPDNAVLRNDLGFELMRAQQWDEAERELLRAIELQPDLATAHINLAMVQAKSEQFAESLASFQAVLPEADAYYNLGLMFRGQQRYSEAVEAFQHVLTISPEFPAAKIQLEQLAARAQAAAATETVVQGPKPESIYDDTSIAEEKNKVDPEHQSGITLTTPPATIAVADADAHTDDDSSIDRPIVGDEVVQKTSKDVFVEETSLESPTAGAVQESVNAPCVEEMMILSIDAPTEYAAAEVEELAGDEPDAVAFLEEPQVVATTMESMESPAPCDTDLVEVDADEVIAALPTAPIGQTMDSKDSWTMLEELEARVAMLRLEVQATMPDMVGENELALMYEALTTPPTWIEQVAPITDDKSVTAKDDGDSDAPIVEVVENSPVEFVEEPQVVAEAVDETVGPPDPCESEFEEIVADEVIVALPAAVTTKPTGIRDSWAMLEELETKVAMLRHETQAARIAKASGHELALMNETPTNTPTQIEHGAPIFDAVPVSASEEENEFDVFDLPSVEINKRDAVKTDGPPTPSDAGEESPRKEPAFSNRTSLWTTEFGELTTLLAIVRNETVCWEEYDAQTRELLASGGSGPPL